MPIDNSMPFQKLDVYIAAQEIARLVNEAGITHTELRAQAQRASVNFSPTTRGIHKGFSAGDVGWGYISGWHSIARGVGV